MTKSILDEEVYARVFLQHDLDGLREIQLELWSTFRDHGLGGSPQECRGMANALIERALRRFAEEATSYIDICHTDDPTELLVRLREVMSTRSE